MKSNWITSAGHIYFMTNTVREWIPVFCCTNLIHEIFHVWNFYRSKKNIKIYSFVIMPDHIHYIIDIPEGGYSLSDFNRDFKKRIGRITRESVENKQLPIDKFYSTNIKLKNSLTRVPRLFHEALKRRHRFTLWRNNEMPIIIESDYVFEQKVNYINENPVRKGLVEYSENFPFSSGNEKQNQFETDETLLW